MPAFIFVKEEGIAIDVEPILKHKSVNLMTGYTGLVFIFFVFILGLFLKDCMTSPFSKDLVILEYNFKLHLKRIVAYFVISEFLLLRHYLPRIAVRVLC